MRQMHHGTLWAEDYEFNKIDDIVNDFRNMKNQEELNKRYYKEIENIPTKERKLLEKNQIIDILRGKKGVREILKLNLVFVKHSNQFKKFHPKSNIEYQGVLSVKFRDYLISQPDLKPIINKNLKENGIYGKGEIKHQIVYDYFDTLYDKNSSGPSTLELYRTFLNFKSHELRTKLRIVRVRCPHYYSKNRAF